MNKEDLKIGDKVEVNMGNSSYFAWDERIFIAHALEGSILAVAKGLEDRDHTGISDSFEVSNWKKDEWRMKEEPEYVPYSFEDAKELLGMKIEYDECYFIIHSIFGECVKFGHASKESYEELLKNYTKLDGTPCGKLKE